MGASQKTHLELALEDACTAVLEHFSLHNSTDGTPYSFDFPKNSVIKARYHIRIKAVKDDVRVEFALGHLNRQWSLVLDAAGPLTDLGKASILQALHTMLSWETGS